MWAVTQGFFSKEAMSFIFNLSNKNVQYMYISLEEEKKAVLQG